MKFLMKTILFFIFSICTLLSTLVSLAQAQYKFRSLTDSDRAAISEFTSAVREYVEFRDDVTRRTGQELETNTFQRSYIAAMRREQLNRGAEGHEIVLLPGGKMTAIFGVMYHSRNYDGCITRICQDYNGGEPDYQNIFDFRLVEIYPTDSPNLSVVYNRSSARIYQGALADEFLSSVSTWTRQWTEEKRALSCCMGLTK